MAFYQFMKAFLLFCNFDSLLDDPISVSNPQQAENEESL